MIIQSICVCGAGTMGAGIAQTAAQHHIPCLLFDIRAEQLEHARIQINNDLDKLVARGKMEAEEKERVLKYLQYSSQLNDCLADIIIEAIIEKEEAKTALFNQLAEINHSETLFASNTSSLSIASIGKGIKHPERLAGMHFFNPATIMKLVEVVKAPATRPEVIESIMDLARRLGKTPVQCADAPGFIVNHVARPFYLEALRLVETGAATPEAIDQLMESSGFRLGPFRLMDLIGNDINYTVSVSVYEQLGRPERLKPSVLQAQKVQEGALGRKTEKGYYDYGKAENK